jgi:hypothetical protein
MIAQPSYRQIVLNQLRVGVASPLENRLDTIRSFGVQSLVLFGSVARDEASETSDRPGMLGAIASVLFLGVIVYVRF